MTNDELQKIFTYHPPIGDQQANYEAIRNHAKHFALMINDICPESREKSLAITALQQTVQWANAAIAIHGSYT